MRLVYVLIALITYIPLLSMASTPVGNVIKLYHDADWSNNIESAQSIWLGVETALSEVGHEVQGYKIELVKKDHAGNVVLSKRNMLEFMNDTKAMAILSGMHSPPLIKHRSFINENKLLTLVPWAAGGPITRYPSEENWVFRVSIDDTKAGEVLIDYAHNDKNCKIPHLLIENSSWGDSNLESMSLASQRRGETPFKVTRFDGNMKSYTALDVVHRVIKQAASCIILISNALEGAEVAKAMSHVVEHKRLPIISHWGITGGLFHKLVPLEVREKIDLSFIQSCFSFMGQPLSRKGFEVFSQAKALFPDVINTPIDIRSPVGFIHGYDLTLLLLSALENVKLTGNSLQDRNSVRLALEDIRQPVDGLIKTYQQPFTVFSDSNSDAHEALGIQDYCMGKYGDNDEIRLLTKRVISKL